MVWTKMMALASLINPALNLVLIPYFQRTQGNGAIGASIAMVVTEVVLAVIGYVLVRDTFTRNSVVRLLRAALATALMAGVVILALRAGLVAGIVSGMVSFPLFAGLLGVLSAAERHQLWDLLGAARTRAAAPAERAQPGALRTRSSRGARYRRECASMGKRKLVRAPRAKAASRPSPVGLRRSSRLRHATMPKRPRMTNVGRATGS